MNVASIRTCYLNNLSDLHVLAITRGSIRAVQLVYMADPMALTDAVVEDAFRYGSSGEVLRFLVKKNGLSGSKASELLAKQFLEAVPLLRMSPSIASEAIAHLMDLVQTFPDGISNPDSSGYFCPLTIVLFSEVFPQKLLDSMIGNIPKDAAFHLRSNHEFSWGESFHHRIRTSLDDLRCMKAIGSIMSKVESMSMYRRQLTEQEVKKLLAMLFHTTTRIKKVHIDWDTIDAATSGWAVRQMIDQAKSKLEDIEGGPPITLFSIGHLDSEPQPEAIRSLLLPMKNLIRLDLFFGEPQTVSHELCKALCDLIKQGKLQEVALMGPTAAAGTLLPLLDAADKSNTMTRLRLEDLGNEAEVEIYQDEMLRILDHNTQLEAALICDEIVNASAFTDSVKAATARINNEWCWRQFEGSRKQRLIDCKALLNMCGRGKAKAEGTQLEDIVCMISPDTLVDKIQFLNFEGEAKQELITILQHGLLRQQPATWLPLRKEAKSARSNNESGASSTGETRGTRKRKATGPPDGHGDHGASSSR